MSRIYMWIACAYEYCKQKVTSFFFKCGGISKLTLEFASEVVRALYRHHWQTRRQAESLQNWGRM